MVALSSFPSLIKIVLNFFYIFIVFLKSRQGKKKVNPYVGILVLSTCKIDNLF